MRQRFEIEYLPFATGAPQRPHKKRGFLNRLLRLLFPKLLDSCSCPAHRSSRGEEVAEPRVIEF